MGKKIIEIKGVLEKNSVIAFMEDVIAGLKSGIIHISCGEQAATIKPQDGAEVEIEASVKKGKQKLAIELTWREEPKQQNQVAFSIAPEEPAPVEEPTPAEAVGSTDVPAEAPAPEAVPEAAAEVAPETGLETPVEGKRGKRH